MKKTNEGMIKMQMFLDYAKPLSMTGIIIAFVLLGLSAWNHNTENTIGACLILTFAWTTLALLPVKKEK